MRKLTDEDAAVIAEDIANLLEERFTGNMQKALGKWVFGLILKTVGMAALALGAYFYGKGGHP